MSFRTDWKVDMEASWHYQILVVAVVSVKGYFVNIPWSNMYVMIANVCQAYHEVQLLIHQRCVRK